MVSGGESFWEAVRGPFLRREIGRDEVQELLLRTYREGGHSYRGAARLFRIEGQHKKLLDFVRNHRLGIRD